MFAYQVQSYQMLHKSCPSNYSSKPSHEAGETQTVTSWIFFFTNVSVLWNITLYSPLKVSRRFGRTIHRHLQGWKLSQAGRVLHPGFSLVLLFSPED
jgi:hypothetical protein